MSALWVWVEDLASTGPRTLKEEEARHVVTRRLRVGEVLVVFDGQGRMAEARVESLGKRSTVVEIESIQLNVRPDPTLMIASSIPKGDRLGTMLTMLTQLGLEIWQPLILADSSVRKLDLHAARLNRILIESCKVARRTWRLEVREPRSLDAVLEEESPTRAVYFGDREAGVGVGLTSGKSLVVIGPEAGLSDSEGVALENVGARPISLSSHNLRIETAAVAAATAFNLVRG